MSASLQLEVGPSPLNVCQSHSRCGLGPVIVVLFSLSSVGVKISSAGVSIG